MLLVACGVDARSAEGASFAPSSTGEGEDGDGDGDGDATSTATTTSTSTGDGEADSTGDEGPGLGCGDGVVDPGEQCDDGNDDTTDACVECQLSYCGDGFVQSGVEQCDDGNDVDTDDCLPVFCTAAACGDGSLWAGHEECDDGNDEDGDDCPTTCENAYCGDGFKWADEEECDDGNDVDDDVCTGDCTSNGIFWQGDFVQGQDSPQECNTWNAWRASLQGYQFSRVAIWGSQDQTGVECVGADADTICQALASGGFANVDCGGRNWTVSDCGGVELSASGDCVCAVGHTVRPCIGFGFFGGADTDTCSPPTQTLEVVCQ
jgi:cysteine-rich repeat protein